MAKPSVAPYLGGAVRKSSSRTKAIALYLALFVAGDAHGFAQVFINTQSGNWSNSATWGKTGTVAGTEYPSGFANIIAIDKGTVTLTDSSSVVPLAFVIGQGATFVIADGGSLYSSADLAIGNGKGGTFDIQKGGSFSGPLSVRTGGTTALILGDQVAIGGGLSFADSTGTLRAEVNNSDDAFIDGPISGGGFAQNDNALIKTGSGTLTLGGANTYSGGTLIQNGTVEVSADDNLGTPSGAISLSGAGRLLTDAVQGISSDRAITITDKGTLAAVAGTSASYAGTISGAALTVGDDKHTGVVSLGGANGFTGGLTIDSATVEVSADGNLGASSGGVTLIRGGELLTTASGFATDRSFTITDGGTLAALSGTEAFYEGTFSGGHLTVGDGTNDGLVSFATTAVVTGAAGKSGLTGSNGDNGGNGGIGSVGVTLNNGAFLSSDGTIAGGAGGNGSDALYSRQTLGYLGNGGNGGAGTTGLVMNTHANLTNYGSVTGGNGGTGGSGIDGGTGGAGGVGVNMGSAATVTNDGTIAGGTGGIGGNGYYGSFGGAGGIAVIEGASSTLLNRGTISGGTGGEVHNNGENMAATGGVAVAVGTNARLTNDATITGGSGNAGVGFYGSGGTGGVAVTVASGATIINYGTVTGGAGGIGAGGYYDGIGGTGGGGVTLAKGASIDNEGSIAGGAAGAVSFGPPYTGFGGEAITASGNDRITNSGSIAGGIGFGGQTQAIVLGGGGNTLELFSTSLISGDVISNSGATNGGDTLQLGPGGGTFAVSGIGGTAAQYQGFTNYLKSGAGTWTLTGQVGNVGGGIILAGGATTSGTRALTTNGGITITGGGGGYGPPIISPGAPAVTPWTVTGGVLAISSDANLGNISGTLTLDGGTLQTTEALTSSRNVALESGGGAIDTDGNSVTLSGSISGGGYLAANDSAGTGVLSLKGTNTYRGGTTVTSGTLLANSANSTGAGRVNIASGGTLGGSGTINPSAVLTGAAVTVASGATLNQSIVTGGLGTSTLTLQLAHAGSIPTASVNLLQGAKFAFDLGASGVSDQVSITGGRLTLNGQNFSDFTFTTLTDFTGSGTYDLFTTYKSGDLSGQLGTTSGFIDGYAASLSIENSQDLVLTVTPESSYLPLEAHFLPEFRMVTDAVAVPEPSSLALTVAGLTVLFCFRRRKDKV